MVKLFIMDLDTLHHAYNILRKLQFSNHVTKLYGSDHGRIRNVNMHCFTDMGKEQQTTCFFAQSLYIKYQHIMLLSDTIKTPFSRDFLSI